MVSCLGMLRDLCGIQDVLLIPEEYIDFVHVCNYDTDNKVIVMRLTFSQEEEVKCFLQEWTGTSHVVWRISKKDPKNMSAGKRNLFWCSYHCQCSNLQLRKSKNVHVKHTDCKARMTVTIKRIVQYCRSADGHLPNFPTLIRLQHDHNHEIYSKDILRCKDVPECLKIRFEDFFAQGFSPLSAMDMHLHDLYEHYGENYTFVLADRSIYPDFKWCYREFYGYLSKNRGIRPINKLQEKVDKYNEKMGCRRAMLNDEESVIAICTPLMYHIHLLWADSGNVVFVDSVGSLNNEFYLYTLSTVSPAGPLPLGIFIVPSREDHFLSIGLDNFKLILHENGFYRKMEPDVILISLDHKNIFKKHFPNSKFYTPIYHLLERMWKFLYDSKNKIPKDKREYLFTKFKEMVSTKNETKATDIYLEIKNMDKFPNYVEFVEEIWKLNKSWIVPTNEKTVRKCSIGKAVLRIITDKITNRRKVYNYNIFEIFNFITTRLDKYYEIFLSGYVLDTPKIRSIQRLFPYFDISNLIILNKTIDHIIYEITEETCEKQVFIVNTSLWLCTCQAGQTGSSCIHQFFIYNHLNKIESEFVFSRYAKSIFNKIISLLHKPETTDENKFVEECMEDEIKNDKQCIKKFKNYAENLIKKAEEHVGYIPIIKEFNSQFELLLESENTMTGLDNDNIGDSMLIDEISDDNDECENSELVTNDAAAVVDDNNIEYVTLYV